MGQVFMHETLTGIWSILQDGLRGAPTFHLTQQQFLDLVVHPGSEAIGEGIIEVALPFHVFAIRPDQSYFAEGVLDDGLRGKTRFIGAVLAQIGDPNPGEEHVNANILFGYETYLENGEIHRYASASLLHRNGELVLDGRIGSTDPDPERVKRVFLSVASAPLRFAHLLNHREVRVVEKAMTRAERRRDGGDSKRPNYGIYIPPTITLSRAVDEACRGENVRERDPHMVRGHLRTDRYGRKRIKVRPHARCKRDGIIPEIKSYQAYNLGNVYH
jgi:hypothetical protein